MSIKLIEYLESRFGGDLLVSRFVRSEDSKTPRLIEALRLVLEDALPTGDSVVAICTILRHTARSASPDSHAHILHRVRDCIMTSQPPLSVGFPGNKSSFLQTSTIGALLTHTYSLSTWIIPGSDISPKGFLLFRARSSFGGVDAIFSDMRSDGRWVLTLRSHLDRTGGGQQKSEARGYLHLSVSQWTHIVVKHERQDGRADKIRVYINGKVTVEDDLLYPFSPSTPTQCQWTFGLGFKGRLSSLCFYNDDLTDLFVNIVYSLGPLVRTPLVNGAVSVPQSTFDTGHVILGSRMSRGRFAQRLCNLSTVFSISALHVLPDAHVLTVPLGECGLEQINMLQESQISQQLQYESSLASSSLLISMSGDCVARVHHSWVDKWIDAGGISLSLYMLFVYCQTDNIVCVKASLRLLISLLAHSPDLKEQFIQIHGFHVIASNLALLRDKHRLLDGEIVDLIMATSNALEGGYYASHQASSSGGLHVDASTSALPQTSSALPRDDGIPALLQGVLFDFRLWGECDVAVQRHLLSEVLIFVSLPLLRDEHELQRSIGTQRILDLLRVHVLRSADNVIPVSVDVNSSSGGSTASTTAPDATLNSQSPPDVKSAPADILADCADIGCRLLMISVESALSLYAKTSLKRYAYHDIEALLLCLEEGRNRLLLERILRVLNKVRILSPSLLVEILDQMRFSETAVTKLMSQGRFSDEIRREVIALVIWQYSEVLKTVPHRLLGLRRSLLVSLNNLHVLHYSQSQFKSGSLGPLGDWGVSSSGIDKNTTAANLALRSLKSSSDSRKVTELQGDIKKILRPMEKAWMVLNMLAEYLRYEILGVGVWDADVVSAAVITGYEGSTTSNGAKGVTEKAEAESSTADASSSNLASSSENGQLQHGEYHIQQRVVNHVLSMFFHDSTSSKSRQLHFWLALPLLPPLLACCDAAVFQQVMMSVIVSLKTDDSQMEAICCLPDRHWISVLIDIALIGVRYGVQLNNNNKNSNSADEDEFRIASFQSSNSQQQEAGIVITCTELALDALATLLEHKTVNYTLESWSAWNCLQNCLKSACAENHGTGERGDNSVHRAAPAAQDSYSDSDTGLERRLLIRCLSLVFQRLSRSSEKYSIGVTRCLENLLALVQTSKLCGQPWSPMDGKESGRIRSVPSLLEIFADPATTGAVAEPSAAMHTKGDNSLFVSSSDASFSFSSPIPDQTEDEELLLFHVLELVSTLRTRVQSANPSSPTQQSTLIGQESKVMRRALLIALACMRVVGERAADKISNEVIANLAYMSSTIGPAEAAGRDGQSFEVRIDANDFKDTVLLIFSRLREAIKDDHLSESIRGRYCALVYLICHHFIELRYSLSHGGPVPNHVLPALDAMAGIDTCNDVDVIFKLLDVSMRTATSISFEEDISFENPVSEEDVSPEGVDAMSFGVAPEPSAFAREDSCATPTDNFKAPITSGCEGSSAVIDGDDVDAISPVDASIMSDVEEDEVNPAEGIVPLSQHSSSTENSVSTATAFGVDNPSSSASSSPSKSIPTLGSPTRAPSKTPAAPSHEQLLYVPWLRTRQGILHDRVDSERFRLARAIESIQLGTAASDRHWRRLRRKVEAECFYDAHPVQWKVGIAHEGSFPGRRRVVLRPRFDIDWESEASQAYQHDDDERYEQAGVGAADATADDSGTPKSPFTARVTPRTPNSAISLEDSEEVKKALAKLISGKIRDVARTEDVSNEILDPGNVGTSWGLVGADGSDEGYGIIGLDSTENSRSAVGKASATDASLSRGCQDNQKMLDDGGGKVVSSSMAVDSSMTGDIRCIEEALYRGRGVDTGPKHSGTHKILATVTAHAHHAASTTSSTVASTATTTAVRVIMVTASGNFWGTLALSQATDEVYFMSSFEPNDGHNDDEAAVNAAASLRMRRRRWVVSSISAIYMRRYRLRDSAMEVFFRRGKHRHFFVDFGHTKADARARLFFARVLMEAAPSNAFKHWHMMSPFRLVLEHQGLQEGWINGEISNFDYLMALNTVSGRSFNDLCQYPVMPWVLQQYTEPTLDLDNPAVYRDLTLPMGALNPVRLEEFLDRYNSFNENLTKDIPPFMYGSHYSTMVGVVLHFLVRLQPFASLHKAMQNGHFDVPDRLFASIPRAFKHNTTQLSEVKELTPEWFTTPDMFRNVNNFNLGKTQDGDIIGDVELPPWASSPEEFVRLNREALESDFVSAHLHNWIDLIFGYKQRGPEAVAAHNVFYYLTYAGSVDRELIKDEALRKATELQIAHFGQIPQCLFRHPHPSRRYRHRPSPAAVANQRQNHVAPSLVSTVTPRPLKDCFTPSHHRNSPSSNGATAGPVYTGPDYDRYDNRAMSVESPHGTAAAFDSHGSGPESVMSSISRPAETTSHSSRIAASSSAFSETVADDAYAIVAAMCYEEWLSSTSPASCVSRRGSYSQLSRAAVALGQTRIEGTSSLDASALSHPAGSGSGSFDSPSSELLPRSVNSKNSTDPLAASNNNKTKHTSLSNLGNAHCGNILACCVFVDRVLCVVDSGVIEAYRYATSDSAKEAITANAALQARLRRQAADLAYAQSNATYGATGTSEADAGLNVYDSLVSDQAVISFDDYERNTSADSNARSELSGGVDNDSSTVASATTTTTTTGKEEGDSMYMLPANEPLISVDKDLTRFETLPRIPLTKILLSGLSATSSATTGGVVDESNNVKKLVSCGSSLGHAGRVFSAVEEAASLVCFAKSRNLLLSAGHVDGSVCVREIDIKTGFVVSSGDFCGHRHRVICVSSDSMKGVRTEVVASCDTHGQILVWTVSRLKRSAEAQTAPGKGAETSGMVISRRPQRLFRAEACPNACVDISWQMGVVCYCGRGVARVFSVERDELIRSIDLLPIVGGLTPILSTGAFSPQGEGGRDVKGVSSSHAAVVVIAKDDAAVDCVSAPSPVYPSLSLSSCAFASSPAWSSTLSVARVLLCNDGIVICHVVLRPSSSSLSDNAGVKSGLAVIGIGAVEVRRDLLVSFSFGGRETGRHHCVTAVTCLVCPDKNEVLISGHADGSIALFDPKSLLLLHRYRLHASCVNIPSSLPAKLPSSYTSPGSGGSGSRSVGVPPSAIVRVCVGPTAAAPTVLCASSAAGELFLQPLPDFVLWERTRVPSALSQFVSAPLQAVRGTIQTLGAAFSDQAGALAQNALGELKKLNKSAVIKNVSSFFSSFGKSNAGDSA